MEDVLAVYTRPHDAKRPLVRLDEAAIAEGTDNPAMRARLAKLEHERLAAQAEIAAAGAPPVVELHPNLAQVYARKVDNLRAALGDESIRHEAQAAIRGLITAIHVHPGEKRGQTHLELEGGLITMLNFANPNGPPTPTLT